ncbi:AEC family transporter [Paracoccaceae bacterium]|jgi:predicted permease|nr:AEC family transporter [Paracoccaceae bacterium]
MQALLDVILPVFFVVGLGYAVVWRKVFSTVAVDGLMTYTQNFAIPCLLFMALIKIDLGQAYSFRLMGSYYIGAASGFALGFLGARYIFKRSAEDSVAIGFVSLFSNSVMMGLAITERAYGVDALVANFAIVSLHAPFCYFVGITAMELAKSDGDSIAQVAQNVGKSMMKNALFIAILLGLLVNITDVALPKAFLEGTNMVATTALPAALFGMGGVLYQYRPEGDFGAIAWVVGISLLVHPAIVWSLGQLWDLSISELRSAVLTSAMAPGINCYIFASIYNRAKRVAASGVLIATALSVLTIWCWLQVLP